MQRYMVLHREVSRCTEASLKQYGVQGVYRFKDDVLLLATNRHETHFVCGYLATTMPIYTVEAVEASRREVNFLNINVKIMGGKIVTKPVL